MNIFYFKRVFIKLFFFFSFLQATGAFIILFIQYYSVICRPSADHTVWRPLADIRTRADWSRGKDTNPYTTSAYILINFISFNLKKIVRIFLKL